MVQVVFKSPARVILTTPLVPSSPKHTTSPPGTLASSNPPAQHSRYTGTPGQGLDWPATQFFPTSNYESIPFSPPRNGASLLTDPDQTSPCLMRVVKQTMYGYLLYSLPRQQKPAMRASNRASGSTAIAGADFSPKRF
ncbi:uncharacterized protein LY79DRAFT_576367 [Colletotrichum navitas]|uniref:Uncharacterized protein n=1 Tax=Colletotrichum navitas TaxID=681940 RepID=A0AAD8Q922_9PEZI|nr:uncharacterized protein LY79DRAFT_576367 [Colletotrichum navitas]KAK1598060.1 hypothetical protein LY79DRAFT_576367 [Colletotrichum navitas]